MYYYIVDPGQVKQVSFERVQNELHSSLSEFRISGEIVRATGLRTIPQLVETAIGHGANTLVAVGDDETLQDVINAVGDREMTIGFIPIHPTEISEILGIKNIPHAAKTLASRRVEELDLGLVNHNLFLTRLTFGLSEHANTFSFQYLQSLLSCPEFELKFEANNKFIGRLQVIGGIVVNSRIQDDGQMNCNPTDGLLDVLLLTRLNRWQILKHRRDIALGNFERIPGSSVLHVKNLEISNPEGLPFRLEDKAVARTPVQIEIKAKKLKIIVGRDRKF